MEIRGKDLKELGFKLQLPGEDDDAYWLLKIRDGLSFSVTLKEKRIGMSLKGWGWVTGFDHIKTKEELINLIVNIDPNSLQKE